MLPFFSRMFPSTNLQDLNLDWICRRIMELSKGIIAPWINPDNKNWMVYDTETETFVDSGVCSMGKDGKDAEARPVPRKVIYIGDSYGTDRRESPWTDVLTGLLGLDVDSVYNACQGGIGWLPHADGKCFTRSLSAALASIPWEADRTTDIIVVGGVFSDLSMVDYDINTMPGLLATNMGEFVSIARAACPHATIYYGYPSVCTNTGLVGASQFTQQQYVNNVINFYKSQTSTRGIVLLDNLDVSIMSNSYIDMTEAGQLHPNAAGGQTLAKAILNALYGNYSLQRSGSIACNPGTDNTANRFRLTATVQNGITMLRTRDNATVPLSNKTNYVIGSLPDNLSDRNYINSMTNVYMTCPAVATIGGVTQRISVTVVGDGRNLVAQMPGTYATGDNLTVYPSTAIARTQELFINIA